MRALTVDEANQVGGGIVFTAPLFKVAAATVIAGGVILAKYLTEVEALKTAADLCRDGSDASVKTKEVSLSCTGKKPEAPSKSGGQNAWGTDELLRARLPYEGSL